ncbi:MAG: signal peptidase I [Gemmatimonadota bacterium]
MAKERKSGGATPPKGAPTRRAAGGGGDPKEDSSSGVAWEWTKSVLIAFALFLVMRTFLLQTFVITSGSMENTLLVGDYLIVNRAAIGSRIPFTGEPGIRIPGYSKAHRGDVIVFDPPHEAELKLVKRLIGMPGDTVEMRDKVLYLNGVAQDEPYVRHDDPNGDDSHPWMRWQSDYLAPGVVREGYRPTRDNWGPLVVPEDRYFMLGDNRDRSLDSRYWGLLEGWRLEGRASRIYYSYDKQSLKPFRFFREVRADRIGAQVR